MSGPSVRERASRGRPHGGRSSLGLRIALLTVGVAVLTALAAGLISVNLLQRAGEQTARTTLAALADQAQAQAQVGASAQAAQARARAALQSLNVRIAVIRNPSSGTPTLAGDALATGALTDAQVRQVADGTPLSLRLTRGDGVLLVEARPTPAGGLVLAQRRGDAIALGGVARTQLGWLLVLTAAVAAALGLLVAWRLARPLARTAEAATALARGARDVAVPETGPREVAAVAGSVNALAGALSHSEARQREFLLSVSHDLRTPLTAITGYAESLAEGVIPSERVAEVGVVLGDEARRLERMVSDLLDLARLDARELSLHPVDVDLLGLAAAAAVSWQDRCDRAGVTLRLEQPDPGTWSGPLVVRADPGRLRQALDGLLDNALRVTPAGRPIVVAVRAEGRAAGAAGPRTGGADPHTGDGGRDVAVLEVRDGGPGLTDDDLEVAFERSALYERYRGVRAVGTGLGLAIVERVVTRMGGTVEAGHAREGGARFTVRLPLATGAVDLER